MTFRYSIHCDGCGMDEPGWESVPDGWASVTFTTSANPLTYCPKCWEKMFCSLIEVSR